MELITLNTHPLSSYAGSVFDCRCGRTHTVRTTELRAGSGVIVNLGSAVSLIAPSGSAAVLLTTPKLFDRFGADAERQLRRAGFLIRRELLGEGENIAAGEENPPAVKEVPQAEITAQKLHAISVGEDVRLIIGLGGSTEAEAAKYLGSRLNLPVFLVVTSPDCAKSLTASAQVVSDGVFMLGDSVAPRALLCDYDLLRYAPDNQTAAAFGEIMSRLVAVFDWRFSSLVTGEAYCKNIAEQAFWAADTALKALRGAVKGDARLPALLAELNLRLSAVAQMAESDRLYAGGDDSMLRCLKQLFLHEKRLPKSDGENRFILSVILVKIYRQVLATPEFGFTPSPNNNLRQEKLTEYFGIEPEVAAKHFAFLEKNDALKLRLYRMREYRGELYDLICEIDAMLSEAYRVFKHLYNDDGYSLLRYLDESDVSVCLALAPEFDRGFTLLSQMKHMGLLERYL